MINLLYHSHTIVPAHLEELVGLGVLAANEQVLVALDGVLLDRSGLRLSGPTLHDYCLLTNQRLILWARDYGQHLCVPYLLGDLHAIEGQGLDPLHAQLSLQFCPAGEPEEWFALTLMPIASLRPALTLLRLAAESARALAQHQLAPDETAAEIVAVLSEEIFGDAEGHRAGQAPYRWPGANGVASTVVAPQAEYQATPNQAPEPVYAAGRLARSAWDTLRRSLREAELPFDMNVGSLRELTDAVRAINELVSTVANNPNAQQLAMAMLNRGKGEAAPAASAAPGPVAPFVAPVAPSHPVAAEPAAAAEYHEIPLRRSRPSQAVPAAVPTPAPEVAHSDRGAIPLRRRAPAPAARALSGSGDSETTN